MKSIPPRRPVNNRPESSSSSPPTTIDDLPESLLTQIISFLPTPDAIQASAIAPPWRNLWHALPVVDYDMRVFQSSRPPLPLLITRQRFVKMVNGSIFYRPRFPLRKFRLAISYKDHYPIQSHIHSWILFVMFQQPEELDLDFTEHGYEDDDEQFAFADVLRPFVFYYFVLGGNSSIKVLKLSGCELCKSPGIPGSFKIDSLREMHLEEVSWATMEEFEHLLSMCDNIEKLTLVNVEFVRDWKIVSNSLKHFAMLALDCFGHWDYSTEICAPKLESLIVRDTCDGNYTVKDSSDSLVEAVVEVPENDWRDLAFWANLVRSLDGVESLSIPNMWRCKYLFDMESRRQQGDIEQHVDEVFSETFVFRNLKHVELLTGYSEDCILGLQILLKKCPQLETMALVNKYQPCHDVKEMADKSFVLQMPRVRLVEMKLFQNTEGELFVAGLLKKHGAVLEKIVAYPEIVVGESSFIL